MVFVPKNKRQINLRKKMNDSFRAYSQANSTLQEISYELSMIDENVISSSSGARSSRTNKNNVKEPILKTNDATTLDEVPVINNADIEMSFVEDAVPPSISAEFGSVQLSDLGVNTCDVGVQTCNETFESYSVRREKFSACTKNSNSKTTNINNGFQDSDVASADTFHKYIQISTNSVYINNHFYH
ncbi:hypothetical protein FQA39_LY01532 [Lamprigera yunnana]|nr:hypothetical protein FQA39_LY01532 [Lamprigera yunnana]